VPIPPSPDASAALITAFAERGINWHPNQLVRALDPERKTVSLADGTEMPYDLFLGVPAHRAPSVVRESDLCVDGWIPVNPLTLETSFPDVYAVGDVTSVGTPKAGVFAEGQAAVVAEELIARHHGRSDADGYDGRGICYLEFGDDEVARVEVTFQSGKTPAGRFEGPSDAYAADKSEFGSSRIRRWFAREWTSH
jgi:sulfide:quinone oxidoreductase